MLNFFYFTPADSGIPNPNCLIMMHPAIVGNFNLGPPLSYHSCYTITSSLASPSIRLKEYTILQYALQLTVFEGIEVRDNIDTSVLPTGGGVAVLQIFLAPKPSFEITFGCITLLSILLQLLANGSELGLLLLANVTSFLSLLPGFPCIIIRCRS